MSYRNGYPGGDRFDPYGTTIPTDWEEPPASNEEMRSQIRIVVKEIHGRAAKVQMIPTGYSTLPEKKKWRNLRMRDALSMLEHGVRL